MMLMVGWLGIKDDYQINHPEIIEAGKMVDEITPKDALVIAPYNGDTAFLYQTNRWGWPAIEDSIDNIIAKGADFYVTVDNDGSTLIGNDSGVTRQMSIGANQYYISDGTNTVNESIGTWAIISIEGEGITTGSNTVDFAVDVQASATIKGTDRASYFYLEVVDYT